MFRFLPFLTLFVSSLALARPSSYTELLEYVQPAPDQGETNTCWFVASTGAMELLANKENGIKHPVPYGPYDLSESFVINAPFFENGTSDIDEVVHRFNAGFGVHVRDWPFDAWNGNLINYGVWDAKSVADLPHVKLPRIETQKLFQYGNRYSMNVVRKDDIEDIKEALWEHKSPVLINYNDEDYWHVILIVGYDDEIPGDCYDTDPKECSGKGAFYIRDSFGIPVELRDYDWFRVNGNAAFVVKTKK